MEEQEILKLEAVSIVPDMCRLQDPLAVSIKFTLQQPVPCAIWELIYEADYTNKRQVIALHQSEPRDLAAGAHEYAVSLAELKTEGIKEKHLLQVGVLKLTLQGKGGKNGAMENVTSINMVTQVTKDGSGTLIRNIISPLE